MLKKIEWKFQSFKGKSDEETFMKDVWSFSVKTKKFLGIVLSFMNVMLIAIKFEFFVLSKRVLTETFIHKFSPWVLKFSVFSEKKLSQANLQVNYDIFLVPQNRRKKKRVVLKVCRDFNLVLNEAKLWWASQLSNRLVLNQQGFHLLKPPTSSSPLSIILSTHNSICIFNNLKFYSQNFLSTAYNLLTHCSRFEHIWSERGNLSCIFVCWGKKFSRFQSFNTFFTFSLSHEIELAIPKEKPLVAFTLITTSSSHDYNR